VATALRAHRAGPVEPAGLADDELAVLQAFVRRPGVDLDLAQVAVRATVPLSRARAALTVLTDQGAVAEITSAGRSRYRMRRPERGSLDRR
jgi:DNA-binding IclR family transcriptional regulator